MNLSQLSNHQRTVLWTLLGTIALVFILLVPGMATNRYRFGRAFAYLQLLEEFGFSNEAIASDAKELLVSRANRRAVGYAALYVAGMTPLFGLLGLLVLQGFSIRVGGSPALIGVAMVASGAALSISAAILLGPVPGTPVKAGVVGAVGLWLGLTMIFLLLSGIVALAKRLLPQSRLVVPTGN